LRSPDRKKSKQEIAKEMAKKAKELAKRANEMAKAKAEQKKKQQQQKQQQKYQQKQQKQKQKQMQKEKEQKHQLKKKEMPPKRKALEAYTEDEQRAKKRLSRFEDTVEHEAAATPTPNPAPASTSEAFVGTSQLLERHYLRLTSAPDPASVRPEHVLRQSLAHVLQKWVTAQDYAFVCEQFKSIRQDLTVQHIRNEFAVQVYETHARLALENDDLGEFNQCQTQLEQLYRLLPGTGHMVEFAAYRVLYSLAVGATAALGKAIADLHEAPELLCEGPIAHALQVASAINRQRWVPFFALVKDAPNHAPYLLARLLPQVRQQALKTICTAFRPTVPASFLQLHLGLDSLGSLALALQQLGAPPPSIALDTSEIDTRAILTAMTKTS
jgi:flagellar motor protein MotB